MEVIRYTLQYVNLVDGRTYYHYKPFDSMDDLELFVDDEYDRWSSFEVIVTKA